MKSTLILLFLLLLFNSCTTLDEPDSSKVVQPSSDNVYDEFNRWVYYQMNEQYLWREDLPDSLECDYNLPPKDFFKSLLSYRDRFSYFAYNPFYSESRSVEKIDDLGFEYQVMQDLYGTQWLYVLYVYDYQAKQKGIKRGDLLKKISSGIYKKASIVNGKIQGLEPYDIQLGFDVGNEKSSVLLDSIYNLGNKTIGYLCYLEYSDVKDLIDPLTNFANSGVDELILDLRFNPGGYVSICKFLCNCIVSSKYYGNVFQICSYNDRLSKKYIYENGDKYTYSYFSGLPKPGEEILGEYSIIPLDLDKITVITSSYTASASEATIVCLMPYIKVITVGEKTVGKGVGSWLISNPKYRYAIQPITMRYYNSLMETTPDVGLTPDFYVENGYSVNIEEIGDINERLLSFALTTILSKNMAGNYSVGLNATEEITFTPIGEPSYITKFNNKHYNENN